MDKLVVLLKTNRRAQIIALSVILIILSLAASVFLSLRTKNQVAYQQPSFTHPSPSPRHTTRFANHPIIINIEQDLIGLEASVSSLIIQKHPLLPPSLDMEVRIDK